MIQYLAGLTDVRPVEQLGRLRTYKVDHELTYFLHGSGTIDIASPNRIVVTIDRSGHDGGVILKYHYVPGLRASDGSEVSPVIVLDDPVPFIRIRPRSAVLQLGL